MRIPNDDELGRDLGSKAFGAEEEVVVGIFDKAVVSSDEIDLFREEDGLRSEEGWEGVVVEIRSEDA